MNRRTFLQFTGAGFVGLLLEPSIAAPRLDPAVVAPVYARTKWSVVEEFWFSVPETLAHPRVYTIAVRDQPFQQFGMQRGGMLRWVAAPDHGIALRPCEGFEIDGDVDDWVVVYSQDGHIFQQHNGGVPEPFYRLAVTA